MFMRNQQSCRKKFTIFLGVDAFYYEKKCLYDVLFRQICFFDFFLLLFNFLLRLTSGKYLSNSLDKTDFHY